MLRKPPLLMGEGRGEGQGRDHTLGRRPAIESQSIADSVDRLSDRALVQPTNQAGEHPGNFLHMGFQFRVAILRDERSARGQFQERHTFLNRAARDAKEIPPVGGGEPAIALGNIGGDGERGTIQLASEKAEAARELIGD